MRAKEEMLTDPTHHPDDITDDLLIEDMKTATEAEMRSTLHAIDAQSHLDDIEAILESATEADLENMSERDTMMTTTAETDPLVESPQSLKKPRIKVIEA